MSHDFRFHPSARDEFHESIDYYESRRDGRAFSQGAKRARDRARARACERQRAGARPENVEGLGFELLFEVEATITLICESPTRWPLLAGMDPSLGVRRQVVHRFGFIVVYVIDSDDAVVIVAVAHGKREPGYWLDRLP